MIKSPLLKVGTIEFETITFGLIGNNLKLNNNSIYRGSDNQIIHFLSSKYKQYEETILKVKNRSLEFVLRNDDLFIVGIPARDFDTNFFKEVLKNGG